jgi:hypothetical protein
MSPTIERPTAFLIARPVSAIAGGMLAKDLEGSRAELESEWLEPLSDVTARALRRESRAYPEWDALFNSLIACSSLADGWDSYRAPAPSRLAIENAKALLEQARGFGVMPVHVEPSAMGGIGVTFTAGGREVVIEFYNKGSAHALFADDTAGEMHTQAVPVDMDGLRGVIREVRKHLNAE